MDNLITLTDIKEFWPISLNMEASRVDPYVVRAEQNNLQSILSPQLYNVLKKNFTRDFYNNYFENTLPPWQQVQVAVADVEWVNGDANGIAVSLTGVAPVIMYSKLIYQKVQTHGKPLVLTVTGDTEIPFDVEAWGGHKADMSDKVLLNTVIFGPGLTDPIEVPINPLAQMSYVGFRIRQTVGGGPGKVIIQQAHLKMEQRLYDLFYGQEYKYGSNYLQLYPGIRQLLCSYAYQYVVDNNAIHVTRGGVNKKVGEQTENATDKNISSKNQEAYSEAIRLEGQFLQWISQANSVYPEWTGSKPAKNASVNFFNASRCAKYGF